MSEPTVKSTVRKALSLSNTILVLLIFSELFLSGGIIYFNFNINFLFVCCFLLSSIVLCILILVPTIMLAITLNSSKTSQTKFRIYWTVGGALVIIGSILFFIGMPIFPILVLMAMYIMIYPFLTQTERILMIVSSVMLLVGVMAITLLIILKGNLDDILFTASWCFILLIILVSHGMLFYCNYKAGQSLEYEDFEEKFELKKTPGSIADSLYHEERFDLDIKETQEAREEKKEPEASWEKETTPLVHKKPEGPGELRPPPGFSYPVDDD